MSALVEFLLKWLPSLCKVIRYFTGRKPKPGLVLVVEDDNDDAHQITRALRRLGFEPEVATSGEVAKGMVSHTDYDYIFVDLLMPGMPGEALLRILSDDSPNSECIIVAGQPEQAFYFMQPGDTIIAIKKPVFEESLRRAMGLPRAKVKE